MRTKPSLLRAALLGLCLLLAVPEMALSASMPAQAAPAPSGRVNLEFGQGVHWLQNGNGVVIKLRTVTKGVSLDLGADGLVIKFK